MTLKWDKADVIVVADTEADIEALTAADYRAMLPPSGGDFGPIAKAAHYIVASNGNGQEIAAGLVKSAVCKDWQVSVCAPTEYPDLTHAMEQGGPTLIDAIVRSAKSLHHDEEHAFIDVDMPEVVPNYKTGWPFLDDHLRWTFPEFAVTVGPYGGGKSALDQMLACDFADGAGRELGATASICAWEDADWRVRRNIERFAATREQKNPKRGVEYRIVDLLQRVRHITRRPGEIRDIGWHLQRCELQIKRYNTRFFTFDPWNEHDRVKDPREPETEYVNRMLRDMREFSALHKVIMCIVTHVSGRSFADEGKLKPFRVANAHGSSQ
jgi:hypothetical protein